MHHVSFWVQCGMQHASALHGSSPTVPCRARLGAWLQADDCLHCRVQTTQRSLPATVRWVLHADASCCDLATEDQFVCKKGVCGPPHIYSQDWRVKLVPVACKHTSILRPSRDRNCLILLPAARAPPPLKDFDSQSRPMQAQLTQRRAALQRPNRNGCAPQRRAVLGSRRAGSCVQVRASEFASGRSTAGLKYVLANGLVDYYEVGQRLRAHPPSSQQAQQTYSCVVHGTMQHSASTLAQKGQHSPTCIMAVGCAKHNPGPCCTRAGAGRG